MEAWVFKYWQMISWCVGGIASAACAVHGSILVWLLKSIAKKVDRHEFDSRVKTIEMQIGGMTDHVVDIYKQNGEIVAGLKALKEASLMADKNMKEHIERLEKLPKNGNMGD